MNLERDLILATVEEDNVQRAYFRVHPLLTVGGLVSEEAARLWPDEGCLRIVPDRAEQHTFKDRMRQLNGWCVVDLTRFAPEANKIRTNKNYHPDRGEINQYILYSDTVCSVPEHVFYEVLDGAPDDYAALAAKAVTPCFYIRAEDTLYGPVKRAEPARPETAAAAEAVLYEIGDVTGQQHQILCVAAELPEKPEPAQPAAPAPTAEKPAAPAEKPVLPPPVQRTAAKPAEKSAPEKPTADKPAAEKPAEEALPIGKALNILDQSQTFEETLSGLNQPVSSGANLLHQRSQTPAVPAETPKLTGTPLYRAPVRTSSPQPKNKLQEVVYNQCRVIRNEPPAEPLPSGCTMRRVDNPVENACAALRTAWSMPEAQDQLIDCVLSLNGIMSKLEPRASMAYTGSKLQSALQSRLNDLEAERLTALVQLDKAKAELEAFRKASIETAAEQTRKQLTQLQADKAAMTQSVEELRVQINALIAEREELAGRVNELQQEAIPASLMKLLGDCAVAAPLRGQVLRLSPVCGERTGMDELLARVEQQYLQSDVPFERNRAIAMLVAMAVSNRVGLVTNAPAAAVTFGGNVIRALGWESGFAVQQTLEQRPVVTAAPANGTPAVLMTATADATPVEGLCKVMLTSDAQQTARTVAYRVNQWPMLPLKLSGFVPTVSTTGTPLSAASIAGLVKDDPAERAQIETILKPVLSKIPPLSGEAAAAMCRFISAGAACMEGGLPVAVDWALLLWAVPAMDRSRDKLEALKQLLAEYPLTVAAL